MTTPNMQAMLDATSGRSFGAGGFSAAVAAQSSLGQLWNPIASGKIAILHRAYFWSGAAGLAFSLRITTAAITTLGATPVNKLSSGGAASVMELRSGTNAVVPGNEFVKAAYQTQNIPIEYEPAATVILLPNTGLLVACLNANNNLSFGFEWSERPA